MLVTLILSLLTREFAMQASDRQLTDARTRRLVTEHANKAVVWGGAATLAFTGLATIGSERADIWIAKHIREAPRTAGVVAAGWPPLRAPEASASPPCPR